MSRIKSPQMQVSGRKHTAHPTLLPSVIQEAYNPVAQRISNPLCGEYKVQPINGNSLPGGTISEILRFSERYWMLRNLANY